MSNQVGVEACILSLPIECDGELTGDMTCVTHSWAARLVPICGTAGKPEAMDPIVLSSSRYGDVVLCLLDLGGASHWLHPAGAVR